MSGRVFILHHSAMMLRQVIVDGFSGNRNQKNVIKENEGMYVCFYVCMYIFKTSDLKVMQIWKLTLPGGLDRVGSHGNS